MKLLKAPLVTALVFHHLSPIADLSLRSLHKNYICYMLIYVVAGQSASHNFNFPIAQSLSIAISTGDGPTASSVILR